MRLRFVSKMVRNELRILLPRAAAIDIVIVLATLPIYGLGCEIPLGLLLGTAAMTVNITLLGYASEHCVERPLKQAKRYMFSFYLLRMVILGTAIVMGFKLSFLNSIAVCLPLFYPKVIYTVRAIVRRNKE